MGAVHKETLAQGRGSHEMFDYVPFSDPNVLKELIRNRMQLDVTYIDKVFPNSLLGASSCPEFNENILSVYVDLDNLIEETPLTDRQRYVVDLLMKGYTLTDIADEENTAKSNIHHVLSKAVENMIKQHTKRWLEVHTGRVKEI